MRRSSDLLILWSLLGIVGALLLVWAYPRAFPFRPESWSVTRDEAVAIALTRLTVLGKPVEDSYITASLSRDDILERRLELALDAGDSLERLRATGMPKRVLVWDVFVYPPGGLRDDWVYRAQVSPKGEVLLLQLNLDPQARGAAVAPQEGRNRADTFLVQQGFDLSRYGEPELRSRQLTARTDLTVRYPDRSLPPSTPPGQGRHGVQVHFAGERLAGFSFWFDDPQERALQTAMQPTQFSGLVQLLAVYLLAALVGIPFLKRYHEGEIGVERPVQIFLGVLVAGLFLVLLTAAAQAQTVGFGIATRQQTTWSVGIITLVFWVLPYAVLAFVGWSVGESVCRERWGHKLAAFDALFQRQWGTVTVARSSLRGFAGGVGLAGVVAALLVLLRDSGASPLVSLFQPFDSGWPGLELVASFLAYGLPPLLAVILFLLPAAVKRAGVILGLLAAVAVGAAVAFPFALVVPIRWGFLVSALAVLGPALIFLASDLLAALSAGMVSQLLLFGYPLLTAQDTSLRVHGWSALALAAAPLLVSLRYLRSDRSFHYRYEDVPPHVRRIAERERQRVELETARKIQSSILPDLPPSLNGVEIAHAYLPASEVGGDFYDVLALEDGRLAVAVGDVAGHGVSSGLVMSMAKSALAVQVTFDPDVSAVFNTLNRTVYQTARKRLLATLCYALLDPARRELVYASAGHLFPYRVTVEGMVEALESVAYPLGVRGHLRVEPKTARLSAGDTLFLFSDGIVEARPEGSEEVFGFERLEQSLAVHARLGVDRLRDAILADVDRFTGHAPREDDQTIVVLRLG